MLHYTVLLCSIMYSIPRNCFWFWASSKLWGLWRVIIRKKGAHFYFAQNVSIRTFSSNAPSFGPKAASTSWGHRSRGTFLFMTFFHWVQQFPNSHLFNDPKTLMYHQEPAGWTKNFSKSSYNRESLSFSYKYHIFLETIFLAPSSKKPGIRQIKTVFEKKWRFSRQILSSVEFSDKFLRIFAD
mgnify:CR=1 FL=1